MQKAVRKHIIVVVFSIFLCSAPGIVNAEALSPKDPYSWVRYFNDPLLEAAVQEALNNNYDLQKALARIEAAKAAVARAQAGLKPTLNLRARALELVGLEGPGYSAFAKGVSVIADWDIDIWGEGRLELDAQKARRNALYADLAFARQSIVVETVKVWFLAIETGRQMDLAEKSVETYRNVVTIVEVKYKAGAVPKQDVNLANADLARAEEAYLQVQGANKEATQTLKLLLGRDPGGEITLSENLPDILPYSSGNDSPQLAAERQDLLAARYRHDATSLNLEQAKKKNYPNIQINSSANKLSKELNILTDSNNAFATFGASAEMPLMDGGRNKADTLAAKAEEKEARIGYQKKSLEVRHEVQEALANDELLQKRKEFLEAALAESAQDLGLAQKQYEAGTIDAIKVIYSMLRVEEAEIKLLHLKTAQLMQRADLYVILGGVLHEK
ncbi:MAG: hypothetical protein A3I43_04070 [Omnitrophica WOR_2 bacterium RIFCSPLOWO2_02_FULL_50_19]|nr:MAG: hypothetical protein A3I43_04070 [Omnitrophica WOR_2 bacterium RIFCSPLOWO2_02_FULL_50_19]